MFDETSRNSVGTGKTFRLPTLLRLRRLATNDQKTSQTKILYSFFRTSSHESTLTRPTLAGVNQAAGQTHNHGRRVSHDASGTAAQVLNFSATGSRKAKAKTTLKMFGTTYVE